tara:strand:- start:9527 stop:9712 length:186 start_codon:yes stop_codon:yes gene_type:complete
MLENPNQPFDFFNDYKDTISWLSRILISGNKTERDQAVDAILILKEGFEVWHVEWMNRLKK